MLGSPAGHGGPQRGNLWPISPATAASAANFTADGFGKYGIYSLFPGTANFGNTIYSHSAIGRFSSGTLQSSPNAFHATHKDSIYSGYTFGAPTPPPGSPYSPVPVAQLELLTKGSNIIIHHPQPELPPSPKKTVLNEPKRCIDEKCCPLKQKACLCSPSQKTKFADNASGCSRTNPVDWSTVHVKKEPGTPCQVAEISTSASPIVKVEVTSPNSIATSNGNIPVGIAVARQRIQQHDSASSPSLPPQGLLTTVNTSTHQFKEMTRLTEIDTTTNTGMAAGLSSSGGGALLQCGDDRGAGLAGWTMGGGHGGAMATPTLWQYPAPLPMEPLVPMSLPMPPVGFQLVRDPNTGGFLLLPTTAEPLQQTVVWPSYPQPSSHVLVPQLPPPPLQLLSSATSDFMQTSTTLHQHTQTHSTRLLAVTTDSKRKIPMPMPATTLIKIETDATVDHTKTLQVSTVATNTATVYTDQTVPPLLAAHLIYQHPTANLIVSQTPTQENPCRSQATSPSCLTPPPEVPRDDETMVQDASNQTDAPIDEEPENLKIRPVDVIRPPIHKEEEKPQDIIQNFNVKIEKDTLTNISAYSCTPNPTKSLESEDNAIDNDNHSIDSGLHTSEASESPEEPPRTPEEQARSPERIRKTPDGIRETPERLRETHERLRETPERLQETPERLREIPERIREIPERIRPTPERNPHERVRETPERLRDCPRVPEFFRPQDFVTSTPSEETKLRVAENLREHPDLSGLELLSSIVEFERRHSDEECKVTVKNESKIVPKVVNSVPDSVVCLKSIPEMVKIESEVKKSEENFGGLDLLCALAEQRILEEVSEQKRLQKAFEKSERKKEKRKLKMNHPEEPKHKKSKYYFDENGQKIKIKHKDLKPCEEKPKPCTCNTDYRTYKSEEKAKKFVASKSQSIFEKGDFPSMNPNELNMRLKLADLQRKYKEKQQELVKLKSKKHSSHKECSKRHKSRKKSTHRDLTTPPPILHKIDHQVKPLRTNGELLKPPVLSAMTDQVENRNTMIENRNTMVENRNTMVGNRNPMLGNRNIVSENRNTITENGENQIEDFSGDSTPEKSSKKRKVGRPKKLMALSPYQTITETIVAKKPKKCYAIGYLLAAKQKLLESNVFSDTPPRFIDEPKEKTKIKKEDRKKHKSEKSKIRPKLKAEPLIKTYKDEDDDWHHDEGAEEDMIDVNFDDMQEDQMNGRGQVRRDQGNRDQGNRAQENRDQGSRDQGNRDQESRDQGNRDQGRKDQGSMDQIEEDIQKDVHIDDRCVLKPADLEKGSVRVLTAMGGLFYAGELKAIEPPDVYSITLDGERGNRPHIMPREEILRDAILEVHPLNEDELAPGTRVVAYWSQKYRCLYPGSVAEPDSPNSKFISVDFDDGDNGKIPLKDIRLLPPDYPIIEYDPNPLSSLSKRKRRTSLTEDRKNSITEDRKNSTREDRKNSTTSTVTEESIITDEAAFQGDKTSETLYKDKKKLKKKKRDKMKKEFESQEKKKKKKHKCVDENCQHKNKKHHKKHKKHRKHHHKEVLAEQPLPTVENGNVSSESPEIPEEITQVVDMNDDNAWDGLCEEKCEDVNNEDIDSEDMNNEDMNNEDMNSEDVKCEDIAEDREVFDANPDDEVTLDDVEEALDEKQRVARNRQASCESRSKMTAFLPDSNLWSWLGEGRNYKYRGKKKVHYRSIQRGNEIISIGDAAVFLSTGSPDRPYIGIIERLWETCGSMRSRIRWFYHPEEASGFDIKFEIPGALLESNHEDQNDVQTICRKCEVLPLDDFKSRLNHDKTLYNKVYENQDLYYLAGYYDPSVKKLTINEGTPVVKYVDLTADKRTDSRKKT